MGGEGEDKLLGGKGNDTLIGNSGNDILTGGKGADEFTFNSSNQGIDTIEDFDNCKDIIVVKATGFGDDLEIGRLNRDQFTLGSSATQDTHRFIYDDNGNLFFDPDGTGNQSQQQLAILTDTPNLTQTDIFVF